MKKILTILLAGATLFLNAQERCGTTAITEKMMLENPEYANARSKVNQQTEKWIENHPNHSEKTIITIPVVVHVLYSNNNQNISDAQILSQIDVLNEDFRRTNVDAINTPSIWQSIAADSEIEFCMASTDPNGQPTDGIDRVQTTHGAFGMNSDVHSTSAGGADDWPNDDYLNIWVCNIEPGLLGYATPPSSWTGDGDGLVIGYQYFGRIGTVQSPYNKGRTATHEIGHWLNLDHVWGGGWSSCGDDNVSDTPTQEQENYSCPGYPHNPNSCSTTNPDGDMFMNYMDYTNDACMNLFTNGQKDRMLAAINLFRPNMLNHDLCAGTVGVSETLNQKRELIKIVDVLGRTINQQPTNTPLFYLYDDGSVEKKIIVE
jgi:hypothetical protein